MELEKEDKKKEIIQFFLKNNVLVTKDFLEKLEDGFNLERCYTFISEKIKSKDFLFLNDD